MCHSLSLCPMQTFSSRQLSTKILVAANASEHTNILLRKYNECCLKSDLSSYYSMALLKTVFYRFMAFCYKGIILYLLYEKLGKGPEDCNPKG